MARSTFPKLVKNNIKANILIQLKINNLTKMNTLSYTLKTLMAVPKCVKIVFQIHIKI
jgi:hypothetical protein